MSKNVAVASSPERKDPGGTIFKTRSSNKATEWTICASRNVFPGFSECFMRGFALVTSAQRLIQSALVLIGALGWVFMLAFLPTG